MPKSKNQTEIAALSKDINKFLASKVTSRKKRASNVPEIELELSLLCICGSENQEGSAVCASCNQPLSLVDRVYEAYTRAIDAKASFDVLEAELLEQVYPEYEAGAKSDFNKTYNLAGTNTPGVQVSYKDSFKEIPLEKESFLRERLGDKFNQYFEQVRKISLLDTSNDTISLLLEKLGEETFARIFKIEMSVGTRTDMDRRQFELPEDIRKNVCQQYKAALKIRKRED